MANNCILMSIHPEYAEKIYAGKKGWEYRTILPKLSEITRVLVYETSPVRKITGLFHLGNSIIGHPEFVWQHTKEDSGMKLVDYIRYFKDKRKAVALMILKPYKLLAPIDPYAVIKDFYPPQSFKYFDSYDLVDWTDYDE